jgi:hypothetical protein
MWLISELLYWELSEIPVQWMVEFPDEQVSEWTVYDSLVVYFYVGIPRN